MKKILGLVLAGMMASASAHAVSGDNFDFHGYMRAGTGSNTQGGDQICYNQSSIPGNEFRLGNECGIYGENSFQYYTVKPKHAGDEYFKGNFEFNYVLNGKTASDTSTFGVYGAYVEAGHLNGAHEVFWVGKRYYRDADIHMDDFYYFADTSGNGAGIQEIPAAGGTLAFALLQEDSAKTNAGTAVTTQNGRPRTLMLDTRFFDIPLNEQHQLDFWLGLAGSGSGKDTVTGALYPKNFGWVFGFKEKYKTDMTTNHFAALYGQGLLQGMNLGGTFGTDPTQTMGAAYQSGSNRIRLVDEVVFQCSSKFAAQVAAIFENWSPGTSGINAGQWVSLGARPTYFFDDHYSIAVELGGSNVKQPGATGSPGGKTLIRATIAPQISPKSEFFSRPALRAFFTQTFNQVGPSAAYGFQGEIWF